MSAERPPAGAVAPTHGRSAGPGGGPRATTGLVLAAGAGSRFGDAPKLLADLHGRPVLQHVVDAALAALPRVVVVLGHAADEIRAAVDFGTAEVVECDTWAEGLAASLRRGLQTTGNEEKVLLLLGDQPQVSPSLIEQFTRERPGSRAASNGAPGHPAVLGREQIQAARALTGDEGLKNLQWRLVEVDRPLRDIDTQEDLEDVRREARAVV